MQERRAGVMDVTREGLIVMVVTVEAVR